MKGSLMAVGCFLVGMLLSCHDMAPRYLLEHDYSAQVLWLLLLLCGMAVGGEPRGRELLRQMRPRILLLPLSTVVGTCVGVAILSIFLAHRLADCLAIGAGFGYYSLSSIIISQYRGPELGTLALLGNVFRELLALLCIPLLSRLWTPAAGIVASGVTSMDSCLPSVLNSAGTSWLLPSLVHGMVLEVSIPFWVLFFCTLS